MTDPQAIRESLLRYVDAEIECELLPNDGKGRVGCLTPLEYPDGDGVVVWVSDLGGLFEVTDLGEGQFERLGSVGDKKALKAALAMTASTWDVRISEHGITADGDGGQLGECVWRVASASAEIARVIAGLKPKSEIVHEDEFVQIVDRTFRDRDLSIERGSRLAGKSGHSHTATIFLPDTESIVEPINATPHWSSVNAIYAKFGDLSQSNGFRLYSLLDDRASSPKPDVESMLIQVSSVLPWSRHDDWLKSAFESRGT